MKDKPSIEGRGVLMIQVAIDKNGIGLTKDKMNVTREATVEQHEESSVEK